FLSFPYHTHHRPLHSFPTRRSSDLTGRLRAGNERSSEDIKSSERDVVLRAARRLRGRPQVSSAHSANSNHLPRHRTRSAAGSSGFLCGSSLVAGLSGSKTPGTHSQRSQTEL